MKVLVTHPGRQHSHQAALALQAAGGLAGYWSGVPAVTAHARRVPAFLRSRFARYAPVALDPAADAVVPLDAGVAADRRRALAARVRRLDRFRRLPPVRPLGGARGAPAAARTP